ncbi:MAG: mitochondrial fission ELM1 family protein [Pseudomonadota bacterium]
MPDKDLALNRRNLRCWVISDGKAGMETQCLGLAEAMGLDPEVKRIQVTRPWRWLPPAWVPSPLSRLGPKGDRLKAPWPDILIATGRQSIAPNLAIRDLSGGQCFTVQIQNPVVDPARFDLIVTPKHDLLEGPNVLTTLGSLGRVTTARLQNEAADFADRYAALPRPRVAVLIGGNNKVFRMTADRMTELTDQLAGLVDEGAGLMITPSRRTGAENEKILRQGLTGPAVDIWDGTGPNPYFGILGLADFVVVTCDSINMACEAAGTGKPVFVVSLDGGSAKFTRFHECLQRTGISRPFEGRLEAWDYPPLAETKRIAEAVWQRYDAHERPASTKLSVL